MRALIKHILASTERKDAAGDKVQQNAAADLSRRAVGPEDAEKLAPTNVGGYVVAGAEPTETVTVKGWVRTRRDSKGFSFLELNDGSCLANLQVVVDAGTPGYDQIAQFTTGAAAVIEGKLVASPAPGQKWELHAT